MNQEESFNRIEIKFNGRLIFGVSAKIERPKNSEELVALIDVIKCFASDEGESKPQSDL